MTTCSTWDLRLTNAIPGLKSTGRNLLDARLSPKIETQNPTIDFAERFVLPIRTFQNIFQILYNIFLSRKPLWETTQLMSRIVKSSLLSTLFTPSPSRFRNWKKMFVPDIEESAREWSRWMEEVSTKIIYWKPALLVSTFYCLSYAFPYKWFCWSLALGNIYNIVVIKFCF